MAERREMDTHVMRWIVEFLLRKSIPDTLVKKVLTDVNVPLPNDDVRLKKTVLLRSIEVEVANGSVSEQVLDSLELIEDLHKNDSLPLTCLVGCSVTGAMKAAYCAVAVECTVKYLFGGTLHRRGAQGNYFEAVDRIWRQRIAQKLEGKESELVSDDLRRCRDEIEAAVWDSTAANRLLDRNTRNDALRLVGEYLEEAMAVMGPSFLDFVATSAREMNQKDKTAGAGAGAVAEPTVAEAVADAVVVDGSRGSRKDSKHPTLGSGKGIPKKNGIHKQKLALPHKRRKGQVRISDSEELDVDNSSGGHPEGRQPVDLTSPRKDTDQPLSERHEEPIEANCLRDNMDKPAAENPRTPVRDTDYDGNRDRSSSKCPIELDITTELAKEKASSEVLGGPVMITSIKEQGMNKPPSKRPKRPVRIIDSIGLDMDIPSSKHDVLATAEVHKVQQALKSSSIELQAVVKDPLPDALRKTETLLVDLVRKALSQRTLEENQGEIREPSPSANAVLSEIASKILNQAPSVENQNWKDADPPNPSAHQTSVANMECNTGIPSCDNLNVAPKPSLMERNGTARTFEWDDSIDGSPEDTMNQANRPHLDSPRRKPVSPLRKYQETKIPRRRKVKKWSVEEEDVLREGVQKIGRGRWKQILASRPDVFVDRTEVDLKDKWRNMTKG